MFRELSKTLFLALTVLGIFFDVCQGVLGDHFGVGVDEVGAAKGSVLVGVNEVRREPLHGIWLY